MPLIALTAELDNLLVTAKPPIFMDVGVSQAYLPWHNRHDVLLNTPQATANQLEALIWDDVNHQLIPELAGLPYIEIINTLTGQFLASTLTLPHRIGTGYLSRHKDAKLDGERFRDALKAQVKHDGIYPAVFRLDPMSIVLGCFLSHIQGNMRIPRVVSGQFVAENAVAMPNGGASHDPVSAAGDSIITQGYFVKEKKEKGKIKTQPIKKAADIGLGNVPYVRESYQAERYLAKFVIDTRLVDTSPLDDRAKQLIATLSEYLVAKFLSQPMMLRSECYFSADPDKIQSSPQALRPLDALQTDLRRQIDRCSEAGVWAGVTTVEIPVELKEVEDEETTDSDA